MRLCSSITLLLLVAACADSAASVQPPPPETADAAPSEPVDGSVPEPATPHPLAVKADALFTEAFENGSFSGSVAVVEAGATVFAKAYGSAVREGATPNTVDTIFRIASLTKQFTASAILALAKDAKLSVTDPVSKYFPEYPKANLEKDGVEVTLHHLLSHSSGLPTADRTKYYFDNVWDRPIDKDLLIAEAKLLPLAQKPGTKFQYLNYGYFLLGVVIERVSGQSYEAFLRTRFFDRLGMNDTGAILGAAATPRAAVGYHPTASGSLETMTDDPTFRDRDLTFAFGAGQIYSTVSDLARWERALGAHEIAGEEQLFTPNLNGYGYGWFEKKKGSLVYYWHNGALSPLGFSSFYVRVPSTQRMVVYLSNLDLEMTTDLQGKVAALAVE